MTLVDLLTQIPLEERAAMHQGGQADIQTFFPAAPGAPAEITHQLVPRAPSACRRKTRIRKRGLAWDAKFNLPSDDERFAFERLITCTNLSSTGEEVVCRFAQVWPDCDKLVSSLNVEVVAEYLLQNSATVTILDGNYY